MMSKFVEITSSSIFWRCFVSFVKFSYWSKFHVNFITGPGVIPIYFYKGLTRNPEMEYLNLCNIWRLGRVRVTKFGKNVSDKKLLNVSQIRVKTWRLWLLVMFHRTTTRWWRRIRWRVPLKGDEEVKEEKGLKIFNSKQIINQTSNSFKQKKLEKININQKMKLDK